MAEKQKRRWGDRRDGFLVRDLDGLHVFMPYLLRNRADSEAYISEQIDLTRMLAYLEERNSADESGRKYTMFHVISAAVAKTILLRPKMNRFIKGRRVYQREDVSLAFVAKKQFSDEGEEALLYLAFGEEDSLGTVRDRILREVTENRQGKVDNTIGVVNQLAKLPRFILRIVMQLLLFLDYYGRVPYDIVKEDPDFATVFLSNLGSIKLNAGYHHLNNWGTNSIFCVIGEKHRAPYYDEDGNVEMRTALNLGLTLDERIADGYYYSKTIRLLKHLLYNPELLELPFGEEVDYERTGTLA